MKYFLLYHIYNNSVCFKNGSTLKTCYIYIPIKWHYNITYICDRLSILHYANCKNEIISYHRTSIHHYAAFSRNSLTLGIFYASDIRSTFI